jgi:uncharacterized Fe-S cluster-containing protein
MYRLELPKQIKQKQYKNVNKQTIIRIRPKHCGTQMVIKSMIIIISGPYTTCGQDVHKYLMFSII